jgi:predicted methyltransferase
MFTAAKISKTSIQFALIAAFCLAAFELIAPAARAEAPGAAGDASLQAVIAGSHRDPKNTERDKFRHPNETLGFFGLKPDMSVVEIWPGTGWYTEILAPYLKESGTYYAASWDKDEKRTFVQENLKKYHDKLKSRPDIYDKVTVTELSKSKTNIAPAGSADMVLTFRNVHNWMLHGFDQAVFDAMFAVLKPGGVLGVVEHRADPEAFPDPQAKSGYVQEDQVIQMAEAAGFKLVEKSEINANPRDTRKHPRGVWTLPPTLLLKDRNREKYLAIGESDRMTLKFVKPAS